MVSYKVQYCLFWKPLLSWSLRMLGGWAALCIYASRALIAPPIGGFLAARCALQPTDHRNTSGPSLAKSLVACRLRDSFSFQARAAGTACTSPVSIRFGWRSSFWLLTGVSGSVVLCSYFMVRETAPAAPTSSYLAAAWRTPIWQNNFKCPCDKDQQGGVVLSTRTCRFPKLSVQDTSPSTSVPIAAGDGFSQKYIQHLDTEWVMPWGSACRSTVFERFFSSWPRCWGILDNNNAFMLETFHGCLAYLGMSNVGLSPFLSWHVGNPSWAAFREQLTESWSLCKRNEMHWVDCCCGLAHTHVGKIRCSLARRIWGLPIEQASFLVSLLAFSGEVECIHADTGVVLWIGPCI